MTTEGSNSASFDPEQVACTLTGIEPTELVMGMDGLLYCEECFRVLWPDALVIEVRAATDEMRNAVWEREGEREDVYMTAKTLIESAFPHES